MFYNSYISHVSDLARSGMTLRYASSFKHTLQLQALLHLGTQTFWQQNTSVFKCHDFPPGLRQYFKNHFWWITCAKDEKKSDLKENQDSSKQTIPRLRRKKAVSSTDESDSDSWNEAEAEGNSPSTSAPTPIPTKKDSGGNENENGTSPASPSASPQTTIRGGRHAQDTKRLRLRSLNRDT